MNLSSQKTQWLTQSKTTHFILYAFFFSFSFCHSTIEYLTPLIVNKLPHDVHAFTQGLAIEEGELYESTGLYQQSSLRQLNRSTGQVTRKLFLSPQFFAEGVAAFPHSLVQISWKEQAAFFYDRTSWQLLKVLAYQGEGWGLCRDGSTIWMSNGTSILTQRDPQTFAILKTLPVRWKGKPLVYLNDLECDGNHLYANVWQKDWLVRIDKATGEVNAIIDASQLLSGREKGMLGPEEVLNGIAFCPKTRTFFLTGKGWPWIFEVRLVSQGWRQLSSAELETE